MKINELLFEDIIYPQQFINNHAELIRDEFIDKISAFKKLNNFIDTDKYRYSWTYSLTPKLPKPTNSLEARLITPPYVKEIILDDVNAPQPLISFGESHRDFYGKYWPETKQIAISGYTGAVTKFLMDQVPSKRAKDQLEFLKKRNIDFLRSTAFMKALQHELRHAYDFAVKSKAQHLDKFNSSLDYEHKKSEQLAFLQEWSVFITDKIAAAKDFDDFVKKAWKIISGTVLEKRLKVIDQRKIQQFLQMLFKQVTATTETNYNK